MKKRRIMKENEGYSLIEMIIVIAIIAVMSAAAMVTISIIHNAKAKEAASTLEDALFEVQNNAKGKICVVNGTQEKAYRYALCVYKDGTKYYVRKGYYKGNDLPKNEAASYEFVASENVGSGKGSSFSTYVSVKYVDSTGTSRDVGTGDNAVYIIYDKQGNCMYGYGQFEFYRSGKNNLLNTLVLNKNGSHTSD
mgnify:FL=1